ncbi:hypothetical protein GLOIN_2v1786842 [Rhizophagus irregularis DAOM 181602=DAOM 197198]|nr:hypothetical protein GLOIN_2v1786842 [Rhizophagus irregularis DAOM 181602=DAOM 197198]
MFCQRRIASYLFAICFNSTTCEHGFLILEWLFHKCRLNLNNTRLISDDDINIRIAETFAEDDDEKYNEEQASTQRLTTSGKIIPKTIAIDILDDSDENNAEDDKVDDSSNNKRAGEGDYDYDIDDILGILDDGNNNDDNYDDNEK